MKHKTVALLGIIILLLFVVSGIFFGVNFVRNHPSECKYLQTVNVGSDVTSIYYSFVGENSKPYCDYMAKKNTIDKRGDAVIFTYRLNSIPVSGLQYSCTNKTSSGYTVKIYSNKVIGITACSLYK